MRERTVADWIRAARRGDDAAIEELCLHFGDELYDYCWRKMGREARRWGEPEDVAQQALFETMRGLAGLPPDATDRDVRWRMRAVARRRIQDLLRARRNDAGASAAPSWERDAARTARSEGSVTRDDSQRWLRALVEHLPERYREVVRLCALEGLSYGAAAELLGLPAETVRKRYERARDRLAARMAART